MRKHQVIWISGWQDYFELRENNSSVVMLIQHLPKVTIFTRNYDVVCFLLEMA